ncbi:MAG: nucleoside deaminase [Chitinophagaceae bacterium]|nr:nucleoside deaminase [Chitinophagaceae bacterium]
MNHEHYMKLALQEAKKAFDKDEVPVGAVVVMKDQIIAKGYNQVELLQDATAHAEILALTSAFQGLGCKYLPEATLYVTLEPCLMCSGALFWSKIGQVIYGASDSKNGYRCYCNTSPFHPKTEIQHGLLADECAQLMKDFFKQKR